MNKDLIKNNLKPLFHLQNAILDQGAGYYGKIEVDETLDTKRYPTGMTFRLSLHDESGKSLIVMDNHRLRTPLSENGFAVRLFGYRGDAQRADQHYDLKRYSGPWELLYDFFKEIDAVLEERKLK